MSQGDQRSSTVAWRQPVQGYAFCFKLDSYRDDALLALPEMSERLYFEEDADGVSILAIVEAENAGAALASALAQAEILVRLASLTFSALRVSAMRVAKANMVDSIDRHEWVGLNSTFEEPRPDSLRIASVRLQARRTIGTEVDELGEYEQWPVRLRAALDLFWEAQCAEVNEVRLLLLMSTLDVLISDQVNELVIESVDSKKRRFVQRKVTALLRDAGLPPKLQNRVIHQGLNTHARSVRDVALDYFTQHAPKGFVGKGAPATTNSVADWFDARNAFVHRGERMQASALVDHLNQIVGQSIRHEVGLVQ